VNGVESAINAGETLRAAFGPGDSEAAVKAKKAEEETDAKKAEKNTDVSPEEGALAQARNTVRQAMGDCGFVNVAGKVLDNFKLFLKGPPVGQEVEQLSPSVLDELVAWVAGCIAAKADEATKAQAHVRPEAAVKLLT
jgi:hypothetical protein